MSRAHRRREQSSCEHLTSEQAIPPDAAALLSAATTMAPCRWQTTVVVEASPADRVSRTAARCSGRTVAKSGDADTGWRALATTDQAVPPESSPVTRTRA